VLKTSIGLPGVEFVAACDLCDGRHTLADPIINGVAGKLVPMTRRYRDLLDKEEIDCVAIDGSYKEALCTGASFSV